jgi:hypothetical protein
MMRGFWKADMEFCKNADLEFFMMYLGSNVSYAGNTRYGYMLAKNEDGIILNNPIKISFGTAFSLNPFMTFSKKYNASIDWQETEHNEDTFPSDVTVMYYPSHNKLVFYDKDTVYAILYKDAVLSCVESDASLTPDEVKMKQHEADDNDAEPMESEDI